MGKHTLPLKKDQFSLLLNALGEINNRSKLYVNVTGLFLDIPREEIVGFYDGTSYSEGLIIFLRSAPPLRFR